VAPFSEPIKQIPESIEILIFTEMNLGDPLESTLFLAAKNKATGVNWKVALPTNTDTWQFDLFQGMALLMQQVTRGK
jgi:hypothetical protein